MTETNMKPAIALLGLGTMGHGMATNLVKAGFPLAVWDQKKCRLLRK